MFNVESKTKAKAKMNLIEEIKNRINIVDLSHQLGLEPTKNDFIFSIYKDEKTRSLKLYPETNSFYCFATGQGGDVIDFYKDYYDIDIKQAVREMAEKLGLDYGRWKMEDGRWEERKKTKSQNKKFELLDCETAEDKSFDEILKKRNEIQRIIYADLEHYCGELDEESFKYLTGPKRGLNEKTIEHFKLFSIKNVNETINYLKKTFSSEQLIISGLFAPAGSFVLYNQKLIIPYLQDGEIIYLRGRCLNDEIPNSQSTGKYKGVHNFATNLGSKRLFNRDIFKEMKEDYDLVICEGEFDTMRLCQNGYRAIGIPGVGNFPIDEIKTLEKYEIILAFDNDDAGRKATDDIRKLFSKAVNAIYLKKHKDITEYLNDRTESRLSA